MRWLLAALSARVLEQEIDYLFQSGEAFAHHPEAWEGFAGHIRESCKTTPGADWEVDRRATPPSPLRASLSINLLLH